MKTDQNFFCFDDIVMKTNMYSSTQTHTHTPKMKALQKEAAGQSPPWHHTSTDAPIHSFHSRLNV